MLDKLVKFLTPQPPFVWPEPRVPERLFAYQPQPPIEVLASEARSIFGIVSAVTATGIGTLEAWLNHNPSLQVRLVLTVYPTCPTCQSDLDYLLRIVERCPDRVTVHVRPLDRIADRSTTMICLVAASSQAIHITTGAFEDLDIRRGGPALIFRADPPLVEAVKRYFDWCWGRSRDIRADGVAKIPALIIPEGTFEAAELWQSYLSTCSRIDGLDGSPSGAVSIDPETGQVTLKDEHGTEIKSPTEEIGVPNLDPLSERVARLYEKGALVSIDKLSRIPPLDAPLNPRMFGDWPELQRQRYP